MAMAAAPDQQQLPAGASSASPRLLVHDTTLVAPSPSPPETSLPLTFFDIIWLHSPPVERLFFYRLAPDADAATIISNLKDSLHQAVRAFYPLAGRLRLTPGTSDRYELHYRPGDAVTFTVAECDDVDADIDGFATDDSREVAKTIAALVPPLPKGGGLLALQATLLSARRGLAIGVTVHHAACDGSGSTHFLHTWTAATAACSGAEAPPPPPPVIDRTLLPDPRGLYNIFFQATPSTDESEFVKMSAHLPDKYLGNCVGPAFAIAPKGELAAAGSGGLFSACAAVASAIDEAVDEIGTPSMDAWLDRLREVIAMGVLSVAGSPRFRVYELDFGFGRPAKVDIVSVARTGAVAVAESRSSAGGMEVGVSLQPAGMARYRKCFADAIAWLHQPAELG